MNRNHVVLVAGLMAGLGLGVVHVMTDFGQSMIVLGWGLMGLLLAWLVQSALGGELDFRSAWAALFKRP